MIGKNKSLQAGFTLVEILVATGIFMIIFVVVADIAIMFNSNPERIIKEKKLERELDYTLEFLSQKIRLNTIDYDYYQSSGLNLSSSDYNPSNYLYLIDRDGEQGYFEFNTENNLLYDSQSIHSNNIKFDEIKFYIYPTADPFILASGSKVYSSDEQPRVTIYLEAHYYDEKTGDDFDTNINLQTTITSRYYGR